MAVAKRHAAASLEDERRGGKRSKTNWNIGFAISESWSFATKQKKVETAEAYTSSMMSFLY